MFCIAYYIFIKISCFCCGEISNIPKSFVLSTGLFIKLVYREEIRKLKISDCLSPYEDMVHFVGQQFPILGPNIRLSYRDEDGDEITVSSNREVQVCGSSKQPIKACYLDHVTGY